MIRVFISFCAVVLIAFFSSCRSSVGEKNPGDSPTSGSIQISADESFKPWLDQEVEAFENLYPHAFIHVNYKPETQAIEDVMNDSARLVIASRHLSEYEKAHFTEKGFIPLQIQIATDAVIFIVNPDNSDSIFSYNNMLKILKGTTSKWSELNTSYDFGNVMLVFDNNNSSVLRFVKDSVLRSDSLSANSYIASSNTAVVNYVASNKNAIGVIGFNWISMRVDSDAIKLKSQIKIASVSNPLAHHDSIFYQPTQYHILHYEYPFFRNIYLISVEDHTGLGTGFASFLSSEIGQRVAEKAGLVPAIKPVRIIELKDSF